MPTVTSNANLDTTQYVRVNVGTNPIRLQAHRDSVRVVFMDAKPSRSTESFHALGGLGNPQSMEEEFLDTNCWVLALTDRSSLTVTEFVDYAIPAATIDTVGLKDSANARIDPATEQGQDNILAQLRGDIQRKTEFLPTSDNPTTIYVGEAARGTATSSTGWTIRKSALTYDLLGNVTNIDETQTDRDAAVWDDRATETYT